MWRFGWVFLLMTLFFEVLALFTAFISCCGRLGAALAFVVSSIALFWYSLAVALITYVLTTHSPSPPPISIYLSIYLSIPFCFKSIYPKTRS